MAPIWLSLLLITGGWQYLSKIYTPQSSIGYGLIFCALLLNIAASRKTELGKIPKEWYLVCGALLLIGFALPLPINLGVYFLSAGLLSGLLLPASGIRSSLFSGFVITGSILSVQSLFLPVYYIVSSHSHTLQPLTPIIACMAKAVGLDVTSEANSLFLKTINTGIIEFTTTTDKLGFFFGSNMVLGACAIFGFFAVRRKFKYLAILMITAIIFLMFRYVGMFLVFHESQTMPVFWHPIVFIASFLPLTFIFHWVTLDWVSPGKTCNFHRTSFSRKIAYEMACIFGGTLLFIMACLFRDPGVTKNGRILLDEKHSDWEWTTEKYDTLWYGEKSGYNYNCLYDYLSKFYSVRRNTETLTQNILAQCDILILKTPTTGYSIEEQQAIFKFVTNGGGLYLIGDHTNVFGTSTCLNPIAKMFGLEFNYDATYDLTSGGLQLYYPPAHFRHPAIQQLPPFLFGTSCSLRAPIFSENIIMGSRLLSAYLDYSEKNFFSHKTDIPSVDFGVFLQCVGIRCGKGRVLAFADSTVFSNFWFFLPGKTELFMGCIAWLNKRNLFGFVNILLLAGSFVLFGLSRHFIPFHGGFKVTGFSLFSLLIAIPAAMYLLSFLNRAFYPVREPHTKPVYVSFEKEHSNFELPILRLQGTLPQTFHTFYVWVQRLGYVPRVQTSFSSALKNGSMVIFINPTKSFKKQECRAFSEYIKNGGKALIIDNANNIKSTSNALLAGIGPKLNLKLLPEDTIHDTAMRDIALAINAGSIEGGKPILTLASGKSIMVSSKHGLGEVIVMSASWLFSDAFMGTTSTIPSDKQRKIYKLEFETLSHLAGLSIKP